MTKTNHKPEKEQPLYDIEAVKEDIAEVQYSTGEQQFPKITEKETGKKASELLQQLGVGVIYRTDDGYWFTKKELADSHAKAIKSKVVEYKS